jgi:RNA polymerase-binding transcription factor DksA
VARRDVFDRIEGDLADVESALARLDAGTYDTCEVCGAALTEETLAVAPTTRRCTTCHPVSLTRSDPFS